MSQITYEEFKKVEIRAGEILSAEKIEGSEKLLKLMVNFGEETGSRQIVAGIQQFFPDPATLIGKKCMFVTNLEPRMLMGLESQGMLFAVGGGDIPFSILEVHKDTPSGSLAN